MNNIHTDLPSGADFLNIWIFTAHIWKIWQKKVFLRAHILVSPNRKLSFHYTITSPTPNPLAHYKNTAGTRLYGEAMQLRNVRKTYPWCYAAAYCVYTYFENIHLFEQGGFTSLRARVGWITSYGYHNTAASCRLVFVWFIVFACLILWGLVDFRDDNSFESTCGKCIRTNLHTYTRDRQTWTREQHFKWECVRCYCFVLIVCVAPASNVVDRSTVLQLFHGITSKCLCYSLAGKMCRSLNFTMVGCGTTHSQYPSTTEQTLTQNCHQHNITNMSIAISYYSIRSADICDYNRFGRCDVDENVRTSKFSVPVPIYFFEWKKITHIYIKPPMYLPRIPYSI